LNEQTRQVTVVNELGLHARAAAKIAELAQKAGSTVWILREEESADASSVIDILSIACPKGTTLSIAVDDPADSDVLEAIVKLFEDGFDE
jgi:phosphocarrier protein